MLTPNGGSSPPIRGAVAIGLLGLLLPSPALLAGDFDVVISEIQYHAPETTPGDEGLDFLELQNLATTPVNISGWVLDEGVTFSFPAGISIPPSGFLVVAKDAARLEAAYGISNVIGDFTGKLSNDGEKVALRNAAGHLIDRIDYRDGDPWPENPDGLGPSLEKTNPALNGEDQSSWRSSIFLGGTPGRINSTDSKWLVSTLVAEGATWKYRKGTTEPANPVGAWAAAGFNDTSWSSGASGFGYGDSDDATVLSDMENSYTTVYIRRKLTVPSVTALGYCTLSIVYDDAYVAYLNGTEIRRSSSAGGTAGTPLRFDARADSTHENDDGTDTIDLLEVPGLLHDGDNVLAIQVLNEAVGSSDLSLIPTVTSTHRVTTGIEEPAHDVELNEVLATNGATAGFIELHNEGTQTADISGFKLVDSAFGQGGYVFPADTKLNPRARLIVPASSLSFPITDAPQWFGLVTGDLRFADGVATRGRLPGQAWGRYPDGDGDTFILSSPTPGAANALTLDERIVIDEIRYHPPLASSTEELVELHNRSGSAVDVSGWRLDKGARYQIPNGTSIAAGGFLVISGDPAAVAARYGIAGVLGPWTGKLANGEDKIELKDTSGNRVDVVHYADDGRWPQSTDTAGPDGFGPSIELVNPDSENSDGSAWLASTGIGTPGSASSHVVADPAPGIRSVAHLPGTPSSTDIVTVTARVSDNSGSVASVKLFSRLDGAGAFAQATMLDDGAHGDDLPGDGRYGATLPARANGSIVQFYVEAADGTGHTRRFPSDAPSRVCLYQVDDHVYPVGLPLYRAILRNTDLVELTSRDVQSDVLLDGTFVHGDNVTYNVGIRYRGEHSRDFAVKSFRIQFAHDEPFSDITGLDLNAEDSPISHLSQDLFRRAGVPSPHTRPVAFTLNRSWEARHGGVYLRVEAENSEFLARQFAGDDSGNFYRGYDLGGGRQGDLSYKGPLPSSYQDIYLKKSNQEEDDWSDLIALTEAFTNEPDATFEAALREMIDMPEWIKYFAIEAVLNNQDGCIATNVGEDYYIYHRPSDDKWVIVPWDQNENFGRPEQGIFRQSVDAIQRLVTSTNLKLEYYEAVRELLDGPFGIQVMSRQIDSIRFAFPQPDLDALAAFVPERISTVRPLLPPPSTNKPFVRGDANRDSVVDLSDSVYVLFYLYVGNVSPTCLETLDADDNEEIELTDALYILNFLFKNGPQPPAPFPNPGHDLSDPSPYTCL